MGLQSDPFPPERQAFLEQTYPGAKIAQSGDTWAVLPPGAETPMVTNPPGLEWGDIGQFGGETGPVVAGGGLGAAFGGLPGAVIGAGLASGAREGGQMLAGTQRESGKDVALRAGIEMGMETLPGLKQGYRALRDTIGKRTGREMAKVMENIKPDDLPALINELRERGAINLPDLMNFQKSDNEVLRALAFQVRQFSPTAQTRIVSQLDNIAKAAQDYVPDLGKGQSADALVQQRFKARMEGMRRDLAGEPVDVTQAGQATQGLVKGGIDARKSAMRSAYDEVDRLAELENPVFDISRSQGALAQHEDLWSRATARKSSR